jgi:hypothetical protein
MSSSNVSGRPAGLRASWIRGTALAALLLSGRALAITSQDFQNPAGTPYVASACTGAAAPLTLSPGPGGTGNYLRLLQTTDLNASNTAAFDRSDVGGFTQMTADFDFQIIPGTNRGEGFGFALLNTGTYGWTGTLCDQAEEPNFTKSLGIGFDVHQDAAAADINNNHVSVHWDLSKDGMGNPIPVFVQPYDASSIVDLACGQWIHAKIIVQTGGLSSTVDVLLTPPGGTPTSVIPGGPLTVPGLVPYETRAYFGARNSTNTAEYDIANVNIQYTVDPAVLGKWSAVLPLPIVPIHSVLMPSGKIVSWDRGYNGTLDTTPQRIDPVSWTVTPATHPGVELFCGGMTLRHDGKLLVAGGHLTADSDGRITSFVYDEGTNVWTQLQDMNAGRWYPSLINLSNGDSVVLSGTYFATPGNASTTTFNNLPQVIDGTTGTWRNLTSAVTNLSLYPMVHLAPNGMVIKTGTDNATAYLDTSGPGNWIPIANTFQTYRDYGNSVMYGPGKIILIGGSSSPPINTAQTINLFDATPSWSSTDSMSFARRQASSLLLPDGTILTTGGTSASGFNNITGAVFAAERWDPTSGHWTVMAGANVVRQYHSNTILIPDGRVVSLGGGHPGADHPDGSQSPDNFNAEIYSPPYLFMGPQPTVTAAPAAVAYGQSFTVTTPDAASITDVTLITPNAMTHSFDMNLRLLRPTYLISPGLLTLTAPSDPNLCPPGYYQLFLLKSGVPSVGRMIHIAPNQPPVAVAAAVAPVEATGPSGASVQLDGSGSSDLESPTLTYQWKEGATVLANTAIATVTLSVGVHSITLYVTDGGGLVGTTTISVTVTDTVAPVIQTLSASPSLLRSVTNTLVDVTVSGTATDTVTPVPTLQITGATSNEADPTGNPGDLSPDFQASTALTWKFRSERFTYVRVYTVTVSATDGSGNVGTATVPVRVRGKWFP